MNLVSLMSGQLPPLKPERFVLAFLLLGLSACGGSTPNHVFSGSIMGTSYSVQIAQELLTPEQRAVEQTIADILLAVDNGMSNYKPDSELSRINSMGDISAPLEIGAPLTEVLQMANDVYRRSDGAFDITVSPLVDLWGFGPGGEPGREKVSQPGSEQVVPQPKAIAAALSQLGADALNVNAKTRQLTRLARVQIDLSAIAKGYAVDRVSRALFKLGLNNHLVEVGGELRAAGINSKSAIWTVGIETPTEQRYVPYTAVQLRQKAIATSGDYRNFFEIDGQRYSHTLDPRDGLPVRHELASVTVVHDSCALADAWATALSVLGPEHGLATAEREGLAAYFITRDSDGFKSSESSAFSAYTASIVKD